MEDTGIFATSLSCELALAAESIFIDSQRKIWLGSYVKPKDQLRRVRTLQSTEQWKCSGVLMLYNQQTDCGVAVQIGTWQKGLTWQVREFVVQEYFIV